MPTIQVKFSSSPKSYRATIKVRVWIFHAGSGARNMPPKVRDAYKYGQDGGGVVAMSFTALSAKRVPNGFRALAG